jgi:hypothetical protein
MLLQLKYGANWLKHKEKMVLLLLQIFYEKWCKTHQTCIAVFFFKNPAEEWKMEDAYESVLQIAARQLLVLRAKTCVTESRYVR